MFPLHRRVLRGEFGYSTSFDVGEVELIDDRVPTALRFGE